ncbi:MAG: carbamoyltransferase HypF [Thermoleophilaceae bacterium]
MPRRIRARIEGTVQGVGFRPHVYRLATQLALGGWVLNDERGVLLEVEGAPPAVEVFLGRLRSEAPPLATIEGVSVEDLAPAGIEAFRIELSEGGGEPLALVSPDVATCAACLAEMLDPADRRHRYPFLNCTDCGPRFTIVVGVPYDRPLTTMAGFEMCRACRAEYDDPTDRRFHAQPTACPVCGPRAVLLGGGGEPLACDDGEAPVEGADDAVARTAAALRSGSIVAVKGVGGYHLACRADDDDAVARLRARKHREQKPFALMVADLDAARTLVELSPAEEELLLGRERPIVVARRRPGTPVARSVAPDAPDLGVMLAYAPLHHLLLADAGVALVMTSGNVSDEPIAYEDADALERLRGIADRFLVHDRPIHVRTDDSVLRSLGALPVPGHGMRRAPLMLRRSRGYVPESIPLAVDAPRPILACGAAQKSTFCLAKGGRAWVSHHIGDLENWETLRSWREGVEHFQRLFAVAPEVVAHDLHPEYLSTKEAFDLDGVELVGVQHHHAHLAAVLAEHGETGTAVGAIYDGTCYGKDGSVWGGEVLVGDLAGCERAAHLLEVAMPGGAQAIREPWRMACSWLLAAEECGALPATLAAARDAPPAALAGTIDEERWGQVTALARSGLSSPRTSSMGRLFDAVAALCGLRATVGYEGQAAVELEAIAGTTTSGAADAYPLSLRVVDGEQMAAGLVLDARATIAAVVIDAAAGVEAATIAGRFHAAVAVATAEVLTRCAEAAGTSIAVLAGGVFQNRRLLELTVAALEGRGLRVLLPERLPPNDGAIAYGQAASAAARLSS